MRAAAAKEIKVEKDVENAPHNQALDAIPITAQEFAKTSAT